jgi:hypothetical protein|tara:strand:- start:64 stop:168 length:105 start_codon:yes stop_codon:yes gene_type:complete
MLLKVMIFTAELLPATGLLMGINQFGAVNTAVKL